MYREPNPLEYTIPALHVLVPKNAHGDISGIADVKTTGNKFLTKKKTFEFLTIC